MTVIPGWVKPEPPMAVPSAVLAFYCDGDALWLHWVDPATGACVEGSDVSWPFVEEFALVDDALALGFVDCESFALLE